MYVDVLDDARVQRLPGETVKAWLNLLAVASQHEPRWSLPSLEVIDFKLRYNRPTKTHKVLSDLVSAGLLEFTAGNYTFTEWATRQADSDNGASRQRAYRDRQRSEDGRNASRDSDVTVTPPDRNASRDSDVTVTPPEVEIRSDQIRSDQITEVEAEADQIAAPPAATAATRFTEEQIQDSILKLARDTLGDLPAALKEQITVAAALYKTADVCFALEEAQKHNKRNWAYVETILRRLSKEHGDYFPEHGDYFPRMSKP